LADKAFGGSSGLAVFAVVEEPDTTRQCLIAAARAAAIHPGASVTGLHIEVDPEKIRTTPEEISLQRLREAREGSSHDRAAHVQRIFEAWTTTVDPSIATKWQKGVGTVDAVLTKQAAQADLFVICQPHNLDSTDALHSAIFHSGKLVLFIPREPLREISLTHIAIAWKDTPQANRALMLALPWLLAANHVSILTVGDHPQRTDHLEQILQKSGISSELHQIKSEHGAHIASSLMKEADQIHADALVMGAYRFGELLESIFGGVTSDILHRSSLPVFLAH
jgi:nucleotide-binding universal stress UspA family protein